MPAHTVPAKQPRPAPQPAKDAPDETDRYMGRLEVHLAGLPPPQRLPRLLELKTWWLAEFERWGMRVDGGQATATDLKCSATDWRLTIQAVAKRHAQEVRDAVPEHSQDGFDPERAGGRNA